MSLKFSWKRSIAQAFPSINDPKTYTSSAQNVSYAPNFLNGILDFHVGGIDAAPHHATRFKPCTLSK